MEPAISSASSAIPPRPTGSGGRLLISCPQAARVALTCLPAGKGLAADQAQVLRGETRVGVQVVKHDADVRAHVPRRAVQGLPEELHSTRVRVRDAQRRADGGAFARAVLAEEAPNDAAGHVKTQRPRVKPG